MKKQSENFGKSQNTTMILLLKILSRNNGFVQNFRKTSKHNKEKSEKREERRRRFLS